MSDAAFDFPHTPPAVARYLESKDVKPSFDWRDFSIEEHARSFTAAKTAGFDVARDLRDALVKAQREGLDFEDFRKGVEPTLRAKGWWGKKLVADPTSGDLVEARLGSAARLRTIYVANITSAYAAGAWERAQATKRALPYLEYVISTALHKREEHLAWVGTILLVDDPWWLTHYPPNGFFCQCRTRQISAFEAEARGYDPETAPRPQDFGEELWLNKRTGEFERTPGGIDPGWAGNAGATRQKDALDLLAGRLAAMGEDARRTASADLAGSWLMQRIVRREIVYDPASPDPAVRARGQIGAPLASLPAAVAEATGATAPVLSLTVADAERLRALNPDFSPDDIALVQRILDHGRPARTPAGVAMRATVDGKTWTLMLAAPDAAGATRIDYLGSE